MVDRLIVRGAVGTKVYSQPNRPVCLVVCSVIRGSVDIWLGSNAVTGSVPDLHFGQTNRPEWVSIPSGQYEFTVLASGPGETQASIILGGP